MPQEQGPQDEIEGHTTLTTDWRQLLRGENGMDGEGSPAGGILTIATGPRRYAHFALALARSLDLHEPDIPRAVLTDHYGTFLRPAFDRVIPLQPEWGAGVEQKLRMDMFSPFAETLFIDCDCLVYRPLGAVLAAVRNTTGFGAIGSRYADSTTGHYAVRDLARLVEVTGVDRFPFLQLWNPVVE